MYKVWKVENIVELDDNNERKERTIVYVLAPDIPALRIKASTLGIPYQTYVNKARIKAANLLIPYETYVDMLINDEDEIEL